MTTLIVMPGASLMEITAETGGLRVRCPGCGEEHVFPHVAAGDHVDAAFEHENDCPVHARIEAAIQQYDRTVPRRG